MQQLSRCLPAWPEPHNHCRDTWPYCSHSLAICQCTHIQVCQLRCTYISNGEICCYKSAVWMPGLKVFLTLWSLSHVHHNLSSSSFFLYIFVVCMYFNINNPKKSVRLHIKMTTQLICMNISWRWRWPQYWEAGKVINHAVWHEQPYLSVRSNFTTKDVFLLAFPSTHTRRINCKPLRKRNTHKNTDFSINPYTPHFNQF